MKSFKKILSILVIIFLITSCSNSSDSDQQNNDAAISADEEAVFQETDSYNESDDSQTEAVVVSFDCPEFEKLVRTALNIESGDILSTDMLNLYDIRPNGDKIKSLKGLEYAKNLENFGILRNEIQLESLDPISDLTSLKRITVSYTEIAEPVSFGKLDQVTSLSFIDTNISDVSFLDGFKSLDHLTLTNSGIENIDSIADLNNSVYLSLSRNNITSLEALKGKDKIESLNIQSNNVSDIEPLSDLVSLKILTLSYNPITNLKPLENLPRLTELTIYQDHDIKHLIFDQVEKLEGKGITVDYHR